jgi:hypothetical protein
MGQATGFAIETREIPSGIFLTFVTNYPPPLQAVAMARADSASDQIRKMTRAIEGANQLPEGRCRLF